MTDWNITLQDLIDQCAYVESCQDCDYVWFCDVCNGTPPQDWPKPPEVETC